MKSNLTRILLGLTGVIILAAVGPLAISKEQRAGNMAPARAEFLSDATGGALRSDGLGAFIDGKAQCVTANVSSAGYFYLRTLANGCRTTMSRSVTVDFTNSEIGNPISCPGFLACPHDPVDDDFNQTGALDICGLNVLRDVTIRAVRLFSDPIPANQLTEVQIDLNMSPDSRNTAFYLTGAAYIQPGAANERILTTGTDRSEFYLVMIKKTGERVCLGNYFLPFTIKVTKG